METLGNGTGDRPASPVCSGAWPSLPQWGKEREDKWSEQQNDGFDSNSFYIAGHWTSQEKIKLTTNLTISVYTQRLSMY